MNLGSCACRLLTRHTQHLRTRRFGWLCLVVGVFLGGGARTCRAGCSRWARGFATADGYNILTADCDVGESTQRACNRKHPAPCTPMRAGQDGLFAHY